MNVYRVSLLLHLPDRDTRYAFLVEAPSKHRAEWLSLTEAWNRQLDGVYADTFEITTRMLAENSTIKQVMERCNG